MTILSKPLRRQLETTIKQAREIAAEAAKEAIARMRVAEAEAAAHLSDNNKALRRRLRAHARTLGDTRDAAGAMTTARLQDAASYEIWHRMLFGRFLAERGLLIHPELGAAMSVAELRDLAKEEGAADEWALAERYAAPGLPGVFKPDEPVLALPIAPEFSKRLRAALSGLPEEVFTADDSLGWTYQFWRASEKDAVNAAGGKIGAAELPAVTQLFTEPYMVKFLLHNTLGAWWAGKVLDCDPGLARDAANEDALRDACAICGVTWEFLRFVRDDDGKGSWRPAAGTFPGWPVRAAEITYCDPCCGSGHFLVEAFTILAALRRREEGLSPADAAVAVLRDNLHGLELDGRCVQIAAFNVALAAWKLAGAPIALPSPRIAWVGAPPPMSRTEMGTLANGDAALRRALEALYDQFAQAPLLGSLLEIGAKDLLDADLRERGDAALAKLRGAEPERAEGAVAARGLLDASSMLSQQFVILATNVPFLGQRKQNDKLSAFITTHRAAAKADLGTAMLQRLREIARPGGTVAAVTPQNWLFLDGYRLLREEILAAARLSLVAGLGSRAFETISGEVVNVALIVVCNALPITSTTFVGIDAKAAENASEKAKILLGGATRQLSQSQQARNPDSRIVVSGASFTGNRLLGEFTDTFQGIKTGDDDCYVRYFWENMTESKAWRFMQTTVETHTIWGGASLQVWWKDDGRHLVRRREEGQAMAVVRQAISVGQMSNLPCSMLAAQAFDSNVSPIFVRDQNHVTAVFAYCTSPRFLSDVRALEPSLKANNGVLLKVPFDLVHWTSVAKTQYPTGLPEPYSDDPTQWLFHGHPAFADGGTELHVALSRLAGYRWPGETDPAMRLSDLARERIAQAAALPEVDADGLLPLRAQGADPSLADRLRNMLAKALGAGLSPAQEHALVRAADAKLDKKEAREATLETWLRDRAFRQHCILFQQRPFLWQVWDGLPGGFSAFLHYHRLDSAALGRLTYTLLGDWIRTAKSEGQTARQERAEQLQQKLAKIIEGETPYDIFVRWKPLAKQSLGWDPDLDDGVRLNLRPFMMADILREQPKGISWKKDRGTDTPSAPWYDLGPQYGGKQGDRVNDHHTTLAKKLAARGMS
jgi:hypothetical protein